MYKFKVGDHVQVGDIVGTVVSLPEGEEPGLYEIREQAVYSVALENEMK